MDRKETLAQAVESARKLLDEWPTLLTGLSVMDRPRWHPDTLEYLFLRFLLEAGSRDAALRGPQAAWAALGRRVYELQDEIHRAGGFKGWSFGPMGPDRWVARCVFCDRPYHGQLCEYAGRSWGP